MNPDSIILKMKNHFLKTVLLAWILFISIDFLFHASLLSSLWKDEVAAFKSKSDLFVLIPAGYGSFLLITLLIGYIYFKIFKENPTTKKVISFSLIVGLLISSSNFLGIYSYIEIPVKHLILFNLVYFIEIVSIIFLFYYSKRTESLLKLAKSVSFIVITLVILGIVLQNIM